MGMSQQAAAGILQRTHDGSRSYSHGWLSSSTSGSTGSFDMEGGYMRYVTSLSSMLGTQLPDTIARGRALQSYL